jgi:hypothetical protein
MGRARELGRAAYLKEQGRPKDEWMNHVAEADATEVQLLKASNFSEQAKGNSCQQLCSCGRFATAMD